MPTERSGGTTSRSSNRSFTGDGQSYGVPDRAKVCGLDHLSQEERHKLGLDERVLEWTAFKPNGMAWVSQVFHRYPCQRMEAQQGFTMACGQLQKTHNEAIDELVGDFGGRPRPDQIPAHMKGELLALLHAVEP